MASHPPLTVANSHATVLRTAPPFESTQLALGHVKRVTARAESVCHTHTVVGR